MPRVNRTEICAADEVQVLHLINRCVRRTFLCGKDKRSGRGFSHRKQRIRDRLEELAGGLSACKDLHSTSRLNE